MSRIRIPAGRDVRATRDGPADAQACVVACPPHPQYGGSRTDSRLRAVGDSLASSGIATLRFDYGSWDEGRGERADAESALDWVRDRRERVGLFGYSFGGAVALCVGAERGGLEAVAALAPAPGLEDGSDATAAVTRREGATLVVCGERDDTVDCAAVAAAARSAGHAVETLPTDHHFAGQTDRVAGTVASFFLEHLDASGE